MSSRYAWLGMFLWLLLVIIAILYFRATPSRQLNILARDWEYISISPPKQTTYSLSSQRFSFAAPFENAKPNEMVINDVNFAVIDITDLDIEIIFDPGSFLYQLAIFDRASKSMVTYAPPFEAIPPELEAAVVFRSNNAENLIVVSKQDIEFLSNSQDVVYYMYDEACEFSSSLRYDSISRSKNRLAAITVCGETSDQFVGIIDNPSSFILLSSFSAIKFQDIINLSDEESKYLIVVEPGPETSVRSLSDSMFFEGYPQVSTTEAQGNIFLVPQNFDTLTLHGITGKVSAGIRTESTDELSELSIRLDNDTIFPVAIEWGNRLLINEDGSTRIQPILSVTGVAQEVRLNGVMIIPSRWGDLTPDLQAAVLTLVLTSFGSLILFAVRGKREEPIAPIIHNQIRLPENNTNQNNYFKVVIGTLLFLVIVRLVHKRKKTWWE